MPKISEEAAKRETTMTRKFLICASFVFMKIKVRKPKKIQRPAASPRNPDLELVNKRAIKKSVVSKRYAPSSKLFLFNGFAFMKANAREIGIKTERKAASQFGWPSVEKMRTIGWKEEVQQDTSSDCLKRRHVGS